MYRSPKVEGVQIRRPALPGGHPRSRNNGGAIAPVARGQAEGPYFAVAPHRDRTA
jgi:hypothetical protein